MPNMLRQPVCTNLQRSSEKLLVDMALDQEAKLCDTPCPRARKSAEVAQDHEEMQALATASTEPETGPAPLRNDDASDSTEEIALRQ